MCKNHFAFTEIGTLGYRGEGEQEQDAERDGLGEFAPAEPPHHEWRWSLDEIEPSPEHDGRECNRCESRVLGQSEIFFLYGPRFVAIAGGNKATISFNSQT